MARRGPFSPAALKKVRDRLDFWQELADYLEIGRPDQAKFDRGHEAREIIWWLEARNRLDELPDGLRAIGRDDLAEELEADARRQRPVPDGAVVSPTWPKRHWPAVVAAVVALALVAIAMIVMLNRRSAGCADGAQVRLSLAELIVTVDMACPPAADETDLMIGQPRDEDVDPRNPHPEYYMVWNMGRLPEGRHTRQVKFPAETGVVSYYVLRLDPATSAEFREKMVDDEFTLRLPTTVRRASNTVEATR